MPNSKRGYRKNGRKRGGTRRLGAHEHLMSHKIVTITLKGKPSKVDYYPIPLSKLLDERSIGVDTDIRVVGYNLKFQVATGNNIETCSMNLAHIGPWTRRASAADDFNQQFVEKSFGRAHQAIFSKRVLPDSERQFISPHKDDTNMIVVKMTDVCGVIPGATIKVTAAVHVIRNHLPTAVDGANDPSIDLYEDQDVEDASGGGTPGPQIKTNDIPLIISSGGFDHTLFNDASPYQYTRTGSGPNDSFYVTVTGSTPPNKVGMFKTTNANDQTALQRDYSTQGFEGTITHST